MKNSFFYALAAISLLLFIKKGTDDARKNGEDLTFFDTIIRGFELFNKSKSKDQPAEKSAQYVNDTPPNSQMVSFTMEFNQFQGAALKKQRGVFHKAVIK